MSNIGKYALFEGVYKIIMYYPEIITPIIKVTESCNYTCKFCHYSNNGPNKFMNIDLCKEIILQSVMYNSSCGKNVIKIIFHGGEPLLCGLDYFNEIVQFEKELCRNKYKGFSISNGIQTNGSLISNEWLEFFKNNDFNVGFSFDGDESLNFHYSDKKESLNKVILNYKESSNILKCGILSVITNEHINRSSEFFNFLISNNIHQLGLCFCFNEINNLSISNNGLSKFLLELFDLYFYGDYKINIREFRCIIAKLLKKDVSLCSMNERKKCGSYLTFDSIGNVFFCDIAFDKAKAIGNMDNSSISEIIMNDKYQIERTTCMNNIKNCESNCNLFYICGGGCYRQDIIIDGKAQNYFCDCYKEIYSNIEKKVNHMMSHYKI